MNSGLGCLDKIILMYRSSYFLIISIEETLPLKYSINICEFSSGNERNNLCNMLKITSALQFLLLGSTDFG